MYENYWGLESKPFEPCVDERCYYPSAAHQGSLLKLRYAIENRRPAAVLTGPAGMGKTLLLRLLSAQLPDDVAPVARLAFPQLPAEQLLAQLADELTSHQTDGVPPLRDSVHRVKTLLADNHAAGKHAVVAVDEAQLLDEEVLEPLRLLLNLEFDARPAFTLLLVGSGRLLLQLDRNPELDARVALKCSLPCFAADDSVSYIHHRLAAAGASREIFAPDALEALHQLSEGVPRRIDRLADLSLLVGFAEELDRLEREQVETVAEELGAAS